MTTEINAYVLLLWLADRTARDTHQLIDLAEFSSAENLPLEQVEGAARLLEHHGHVMVHVDFGAVIQARMTQQGLREADRVAAERLDPVARLGYALDELVKDCFADYPTCVLRLDRFIPTAMFLGEHLTIDEVLRAAKYLEDAGLATISIGHGNQPETLTLTSLGVDCAISSMSVRQFLGQRITTATADPVSGRPVCPGEGGAEGADVSHSQPLVVHETAEDQVTEKAAEVAEPRVFISYAHENDGGAHAEQVRALWLLLRDNGIDAQLDRPAAERPQDWAMWMQREYQEADFVLVVASPAYKRRAEGTEAPGVGEGVAWEARLLRDEIYRDSTGWHRRILRVVLPGGSREDLPSFLGGHTITHYTIDFLTAAGAEKLLRYLTAQPYETVPPLGPRPRLEPRGTTLAASDSKVVEEDTEARATGPYTTFTGPTAIQIGDNNQQTNNFGNRA